jgi:hypothetical protein
MLLQESPEAVFKQTGIRLHLGLFGKHPAWDDHMEDIGLDTPSLIEFKNLLYFGGVSGCIDSGAWLKMPAEGRMDVFDHELIWSGETGVIFAVMWNSSDGRGRQAYPMVAAAHFLTSRLPAKVGPVFAALQQVADKCREAADRDAVRLAQSEGVGGLVQAARSLVPLSATAWAADERLAFVGSPCFGENHAGLHRAFYALLSNPGTGAGKLSLRLASEPGALEDLLVWQVLLRSQIQSGSLLLTLRHRDGGWVDALEGEFSASEFVRLKARPEELPLTTSVPYGISDDFREKAEMVLDSFVSDPERIPRLDGCGSEGPGNSLLGSLLGRFFRSPSA